MNLDKEPPILQPASPDAMLDPALTGRERSKALALIVIKRAIRAHLAILLPAVYFYFADVHPSSLIMLFTSSLMLHVTVQMIGRHTSIPWWYEDDFGDMSDIAQSVIFVYFVTLGVILTP